MNNKMDSSATPISLTADPCGGNENRCHIATPAPSTPFPYSPLTPYTAHSYPYLSRYSSSAHLQSAYNSSLNNFASLAYSPDLFHYNPYNAFTPNSPLSPGSFWSLTAQQSYHQLTGLSFGPSSMSYNTNAHLYNLFSPNSISSLSPNADLHSPSLYPRVSSLPSPYASSPGLSSAFMSPSSMPLLLSPSLSSSVDRPPTYLSDNTSTPSTTASMTPIKCEPVEQNCHSQQTSQSINQFNDNISNNNNNNVEERVIERIDNNNTVNEQNGIKHKSKHDNNNKSIKQTVNESKQQSQQDKQQKTITTTITSIPTKSKEKYSARVEPLMRIEETIETVVRNGIDLKMKDNNNFSDNFETIRRSNDNSNSCETLTNERNESPIKNAIKDNNNSLDLSLINAKVKREMIECDMSLPLNSVNSVPNNNIKDNIINNNQLKTNSDSIVVKDDNNFNQNLVIDNNCVKSSDGKEVLINNKKSSNTKNEKVAKRESQLKQLQSYRKESHRLSTKSDNDNGIQSKTAISIVLPKPKDQTDAKDVNTPPIRPVPQSNKTESQPLKSSNTSTTAKTTENHLNSSKSLSNAIQVPVVESHKLNPKTQSVSPVCTKSIEKITTTITTNLTITTQKSTTNAKKLDNSNVSANTQKLTQPNNNNNNNNNNTKPLPKKHRISRKHTSSAIPVGIAIAQQRTSPKTKSPNDSANLSVTTASQPLKPILPTLSLPMVANSPILITDSPPAGTSLWIKPTPNSTLTTNNSLQTGSQFSITGDYQLARDSLTGQLYLIRNSSSLPTTPTATKSPLLPSLTIKSNEHQPKSSPSTILTLPVGPTQPQQFFASLTPTQTSTLILDTTSTAPLVQIAATAPVTSVMPNISSNNTSTFTNNIKIGRHLDVKEVKNVNHINNNTNTNNNNNVNNSLNVERGTQACISDDEVFSCDNMKTTATQVDMDHIHSSEEDDDNDGKRHKLALIQDRKHITDRNSSIDDDEESSRDSIQLQIVDDRCEPSDEISAPVLPVKSAPVMEFIDHHGLDLLVDSIEEFAAREEESNTSTAEPVDGLQLLSALAEQRSLEERGAHDGSPQRRHSADSTINSNVNNNSINSELCLMKKRQRSESCFTSAPINFDENEELFTDFKKLMKTSSCQTDIFDRRRRQLKCDEDLNSFVNLRRSERIFIHESVVANSKDTKDVNNDKEVKDKDKEVLNTKDSKKKDSDIKLKIPKIKDNTINVTNIKTSDVSNVIKPKDNVLVKNKIINSEEMNKSNDEKTIESISAVIKTNSEDKLTLGDNQKVVSDSNNWTKDKTIKKDKKKKHSSLSESIETAISNSCDSISDDIKQKKRKKKQSEESKKRFKTDSEKQINKNTNNSSKKVCEITPKKPIKDSVVLENESLNTSPKTNVEKKIINDKSDDNNSEKSEIIAKKRKQQVIKPLFELYDEKRMKLLDETIDEIIAKNLIQSQTEDKSEETETPLVAEPELPTFANQLSPEPSKSPKPEPNSLPPELPKEKPLVKQLSISSTSTSSSSSSSSLPSISLRLTESDLDLKMNVIMLVDGLLFVGEICPIQAPDIYGIILHGERQHRPHIYSQEEMLREAIREVKPSLEDLDEGQRVCAYWSTQYRHLYPGYVRSSSPHPNLVFVEFDDGDNGRISIDDIRLLPQDYPQMKINADPLKNLERRRRMSSCGKDSRSSKQNSDTNNDNKAEELIENKKSEETSKSKTDNKSNEESNKSSGNESNKKLISLSTKVSKASNTTCIGKVTETGESSTGAFSMKIDMRVKKKKKHTKDDRHHRHHHKHHHCRHHRKCKKHKKSKEANINSISSSSSISSFSSLCKEKSTKSSSRVSSKEVQKKETDAQKVIITNNYSNKDKDKDKDRDKDKEEIIKSKSVTNTESDKPELKTIIKKQPKRTITSATDTSINNRKRHSNDAKDANIVNNSNDNKISSPTPKKRERMPSSEKSKIAPFLPERQLWHWSGKSIRRTGNKGSRTRKVYYKEIERGREHIRVDDCAVFLSTGRPHLPYIGRIDSMWQTGNGTMIVKVRWFYHPEETKGDSVPLVDKRGALFESSHFDVNDVQTISHKCQVISWSDYQEKRSENPKIASDDPPNVYYLAGQYEALSGRIDMDSNVPLKDKPRDG